MDVLPWYQPPWAYKDEGNIDFGFDEGTPIIAYGDDEAMFIRQCPHCARYVKADSEIALNEEFGPRNMANATCAKHGRVKMPFIGYS